MNRRTNEWGREIEDSERERDTERRHINYTKAKPRYEENKLNTDINSKEKVSGGR